MVQLSNKGFSFLLSCLRNGRLHHIWLASHTHVTATASLHAFLKRFLSILDSHTVAHCHNLVREERVLLNAVNNSMLALSCLAKCQIHMLGGDRLLVSSFHPSRSP